MGRSFAQSNQDVELKNVESPNRNRTNLRLINKPEAYKPVSSRIEGGTS